MDFNRSVRILGAAILATSLIGCATTKTETESLLGCWRMQSLELPTATSTSSANVNSIPHATIEFLADGTYQGNLYSPNNGTTNPLMHVSSTWHADRERLYINAVNILGSTNLVVRFRVRYGRLSFDPDPMTPPYAFRSTYSRTATD